jgi:phenylacetate-CoA ligase
MLKFLKRSISSDVQKKLDFLLESQYWSLEECLDYQWKKLKKLIEHAYVYVPFYKTLFDSLNILPADIQSHKDFSLIPALSKRVIQDNFDELVAKNTNINSLVLNSTGGSTGTPLNFYHDAEYSLWSDAARWRAWRYFQGFTEHDLEGVLWGAFRDIGTGLGYKNTLRSIFREGLLLLNTFDLDEKSLKSFIFLFNLLKPNILRGYASSLYYVAEYVDSKKIYFYNPKVIVSTTEVLHERMRKKIESVFSAKIYDSYGCREVSQIATECEFHNGFHIVCENQYVELDGTEIVVTNLNNFSMPLIRYKVGDLASGITYEPCPCGRFSPRIISLIGRDNDNIEFPSGKIVNGEFFEFLFFGISNVIQYQVVYYKSLQKLQIKLHLRNLSDDPSHAIREMLFNKFSFNNIEFIYTENFDKTQTGKLRFVYSVE